MPLDLQAELACALEAAELAAAYARQEYEAFEVIPNAPASISTHVDHHCQELILQHLRKHFPQDGICAEEKTPSAENTPDNTERVWVVDPIDGTRGFAKKNGEFSIMIALTIRNQVVLGVVLEPILYRTTFATLGRGCYIDVQGERRICRVTTTPTLSEATLTQSHSRHGSPPKGVVTALSPKVIHETYSAGVKLALVARGEADLYVNDYLNFHDWDICAGEILVTEAGGQVSLFNGDPVTYGGRGAHQRRGMVATNGLLQADTVQKLRSL
ncbi:MAG: inositol monophosphatase family protein [Fimbriiglobus sp.]